jgi:branched-chain amino acid transport system ATP-binding protein
MLEPVLAARNLTRRFGGVIAVDDVSLELRHGQIHALIGPNGAGKSTFINLLAGELAPTSGTILLRGDPLARARPHRLARLGIGRTFQRSNVFAEFTAFENCRLAAQARNPRAWALHEPAARCATSSEAAARALAAVGLTARGDMPAGLLSHGERRELEIAMCLATDPTVLLLDEPLAGMGAEESKRVLELLRRLKPERAILLVEHDMDAVFAVADVITVMADGAVLASGAPETVRNDPTVREAYLGDAEFDPLAPLAGRGSG